MTTTTEKITLAQFIKDQGLRCDKEGHIIPKRISHKTIDVLIMAGLYMDNYSWPALEGLLKSLGCRAVILDYYGKNRGIEFNKHEGQWFCNLIADRKNHNPIYGVAPTKFRSAVELLRELNIDHRETFTKIKSI